MIPQTTREMVEANATDESNKLRARKANNDIPSEDARPATANGGGSLQDHEEERGGSSRTKLHYVEIQGTQREPRADDVMPNCSLDATWQAVR
ncbi:hypothetical protein K0M31_013407 [Melipona bicolor]|uniref:Uncharacterized protein n=1 Tax=Melipona bicolor TaxID=60889 RepID=A0AA40FI91_9HYME|nr:hypothetical protein K0M31_013407 [Melipona bicolor]